MKSLPGNAPPGKGGAASITTTVAIPVEALTVTAAPPDIISQKNVLAVTGIPPRVFLEELRSPGFPLHVMRLRKLRLVSRAEFLSWLRSRVPTDAEHEAANDSEAPEDIDGVLAELDLERVPSKGIRQASIRPAHDVRRAR